MAINDDLAMRLASVAVHLDQRIEKLRDDLEAEEWVRDHVVEAINLLGKTKRPKMDG